MACVRIGLRGSMLLALVGGCAVAVEDPAVANDEAALDHLEALGFERDEAVVTGDHVIVEGDLRFDRKGLLEGDYERLIPVDGDGALIEKGYRYPAIISEKNRANVRILFASGGYAPSKAVREAFLAAAKAWSEVRGSSIRISPDNTGPAIVVRQVPAKDWDKYTGCKGTDACADPPRNGRPGYEVFVRERSIDAGCEMWSPSALAYAARHELGHALGFAHPKERGSKRVAGSAACAKDSEEDCTYRPGYATVMAAATVSAKCSYSPARVTKDDYATCAAVYPAKPSN